jgi:L-lactate dehydrogenase (cytochrome)
MMKLADCRNIADLRAVAHRKLPAPIFHYLDGGAEDERCLRGNYTAFHDYSLVPSALRDVTTVDTGTTLFGQKVAIPLMLSPTGGSEVFSPEGECAISRAAARANVMYGLSSMSTRTLEQVVEAGGKAPRMFQLYFYKDKGLISNLIRRAEAAGYSALCVTVDTIKHGNRERDLRTGFAIPPRFNARSWLSFACHPRWSLTALTKCKFKMVHVEGLANANAKNPNELAHSLFSQTVTWKDAEEILSQWKGPKVVKGLSSAEDARTAVEIGADAVMISNHGGRQLDDSVAPIRALPWIRDAVGDSAQVIVDGGVRRGTDVLKALALGADACSIGRPYLYGLAAGGEQGVARALEIFRSEIERDMGLMGCASLKDLKPGHVFKHK